MDLFGRVNLHPMWDQLYVVKEHGRDCVDAQATAIKNATKVSFEGQRFLTRSWKTTSWISPSSL